MGPVGSQIDYLECQDTDWEGGNEKGFSMRYYCGMGSC